MWNLLVQKVVKKKEFAVRANSFFYCKGTMNLKILSVPYLIHPLDRLESRGHYL